MHRTMANATVLTAPGSRQTPAFALLCRHLHVLLLPDPMDPFVIYLLLEHFMNARTSEPWADVSDVTHLFDQRSILVRILGTITLRAAWLIQRPARATL